MLSQEVIDLCAEIKRLQSLIKLRDSELASAKLENKKTQDLLEEAYGIIGDLRKKIPDLIDE